MPKYNIELRNASRVWDTVTLDLADHTAARIEVARFVGELLKDHADTIWIDQDWQIDVTDSNGLILYVMNLSAMQTPATMGNAPKS